MAGERLTPGGASKRERMKQLLLTAVAAATGAAGAGALNAALDTDWRDLKTPSEKIDRFRTGPRGFDTDDSFHGAAAERTQGDEQYSHAEYVQYIFSNTVPVKMSESIRDKLAVVSSGIPAQESRYNNNLPTSRSGAKYIWQLSPPAIDHLNRILKTNVKLDDTQSLKVATPLAFAYFDHVLYPAVKDPAERVLTAFGLGEHPEAFEQFVTYCMINAYNAGPTRMAQMLDAFVAKYSPRHVHPTYEYTPLSLFQSFAEVALRPPGSLSDGYKHEAGEYVFRVLAGAEALNAESKFEFEQTLAERVVANSKHSLHVLLQEALKPVAAGVVGGALGHIAGNLATKQGVGTGLSRRTVLKAGAAAAGGTLAHHAYKGNLATPQLPDISSWMWWRKAEKKPASMALFEDGTKYRPHATRERLSAFGGASKLLPRQVATPDLKPYLRNLTTSGVVEEVKKMNRITGEDVAKQTAAYRALSFTVGAVGSGWRCRGVGMGAAQTGANDARYLRLTGPGGAVLKKITAEFQVALKNAGLADGWRIRPIVNSLLRSDGSDGTNKGVVGASRNSPHPVGIGIDFSMSKFDVIHAQTGEFFMTSPTQGERTTDAAFVKKLQDILAGVLVKMHGKDFTLTFEPKADHYHVSAVVPKKTP
ncbi:MAG: DUF5715 family protein [Patescibacteria group bacterium]|mgnify:CR=1 FL=1